MVQLIRSTQCFQLSQIIQNLFAISVPDSKAFVQKQINKNISSEWYYFLKNEEKNFLELRIRN